MSTTLKRTSMALDVETLNALELLSEKWAVSKAEVMRRAVRRAMKEADKSKQRTPQEALEWIRLNGLTQNEADQFQEEVSAQRKAWQDPWENDDTSRH